MSKDLISWRRADESDRDDIENALVYSWKAAQSKGWVASFVESDKVDICNRILEADSIVISDSYLFMYDIYEPWHCRKKVLFEMLCLRIRKNDATFDDVIEVMEELGRRNDCYMVSVASALHHSDESLSKRYESYGFNKEEVRLNKILGE